MSTYLQISNDLAREMNDSHDQASPILLPKLREDHDMEPVAGYVALPQPGLRDMGMVSR